MEFSKHALEKLKLYGLDTDIVREALKTSKVTECADTLKGSKIVVVTIDGKFFSVVIKEQVVITVYRTDLKKLNSRRRSKRWNCY